MDRGVWRAVVPEVAKSWTRLKLLEAGAVSAIEQSEPALCSVCVCVCVCRERERRLYIFIISNFWISFPFKLPQSTEKFPVLYSRFSPVVSLI